jgi:hypothetical protein
MRERDARTGEQLAQALLELFVLAAVALAVLKVLQRGRVPLVQEDQLAVGQHLIDEVVEQAGPGRGALGALRDRLDSVEDLPPDLVEAEVQLDEHVLLALKVVVERRLRRAEALGDVAQRGPLIPALREQLEREVEDLLTRLLAVSPSTVVLGCGLAHDGFSLLDGRQASLLSSPALLAGR